MALCYRYIDELLGTNIVNIYTFLSKNRTKFSVLYVPMSNYLKDEVQQDVFELFVKLFSISESKRGLYNADLSCHQT